MTLKNNRAPLICYIRLYASFHHRMRIQTGLMVWKQLNWVLTSVTLIFDLWPWPFAWISLLPMVITPKIFMMIWWWEHSKKGATDRQTDGRTDWTIHRAAWLQLKMLWPGIKFTDFSWVLGKFIKILDFFRDRKHFFVIPSLFPNSQTTGNPE